MDHERWRRGIKVRRLRHGSATLGVIALTLALIPLGAMAARKVHSSLAWHGIHSQLPAHRIIPYPTLEWPVEINGSQYMPLSWNEIAGWSDDDHLQAYKTFRVSCASIASQRSQVSDSRALGASLRDPCRTAKALEISDGAKAKAFFEEQFVPLQISRL